MKTLATLALLVFASSVFAQEPVCLDASDVQAVRQKVGLVGSGWSELDPCNPTTNTYKILSALIFIKNFSYPKGTLHIGPLNPEIISGDFWDYFTQRIFSVRFETDPELCPEGPASAFVKIPKGEGAVTDHTMYTCDRFYGAAYAGKSRLETFFGRVVLLLHEARHTEGYPHVDCERGPFKGVSGYCDSSIDDKGAYAVSVEATAKIAFYAKGLSDYDRMLVKNIALQGAFQYFNQPVVAGLEAIYLVSADGRKGFIFDGQKLTEVPRVLNSVPISRRIALAGFPTDKTQPSFSFDTYSKSFRPIEAQGSFSLGYNALDADQRPDVIDVINSEDISGNITSHRANLKLVKETGADYTVIPFPFQAQRVYLSQELWMSNRDSIYIVDTQENMYRFQLKGGGQFEIAEVPNVTKGFLGVTILNERNLAIAPDGTLIGAEGRGWVTVPEVGEQKFSSMTRPFAWTEFFSETLGYSH